MKNLSLITLLSLMTTTIFSMQNGIDYKDLKNTIELLYIDRTQHGGQLCQSPMMQNEETWDKLAQQNSFIKESLKIMYFEYFDFTSTTREQKKENEKKFLMICTKLKLPYKSFDDLIQTK